MSLLAKLWDWWDPLGVGTAQNTPVKSWWSRVAFLINSWMCFPNFDFCTCSICCFNALTALTFECNEWSRSVLLVGQAFGMYSRKHLLTASVRISYLPFNSICSLFVHWFSHVCITLFIFWLFCEAVKQCFCKDPTGGVARNTNNMHEWVMQRLVGRF